MSIRLLAAVAVTCLLSHAAIAQDKPVAGPARPVEEKKICRSESATGSIMAKRVCRTRAEWAEINKQNEKQGETFRDRQNHSGPPV